MEQIKDQVIFPVCVDGNVCDAVASKHLDKSGQEYFTVNIFTGPALEVIRENTQWREKRTGEKSDLITQVGAALEQWPKHPAEA
jgi:hypothetical protein